MGIFGLDRRRVRRRCARPGGHGRRRWNLGCLGTIVVGVLGGLIGGLLFSAAGDEGIGDFGLRSMFVAFVGAVLLLLIVGALTRGRYGGSVGRRR